jgi:LysM repeat protein
MRNQLVMSKIFALFLLLSAGFAALNAQNLPYEIVTRNGQAFYIYNVQQGDGLFAISRTFSVSVAEILRHNPDANTGLQPGQKLLIPVVNAENAPTAAPTVAQTVQNAFLTPPPLADQNATFRHTVLRGETLFGIAQMYNTTVAEITALNPGADTGISEGQILTIPQQRIVSENYHFHTILPQETLFSVSRAYSLQPEDVIAANPGLSVETFQIGRIIRIPAVESNENVTAQSGNIRHVVQRGETLFSISRRYDVDIEDIRRLNPMLAEGLRTDMELQIPTRNTSLEGDFFASTHLFPPSQGGNVIRVGLLLPFLDEAGRGHERLQEYYEGFLLAALELKNAGANMEIYPFEIGMGNDTRKLESLLGTLEMQALDLIIGGANDAQIRVLSNFARAYNIKYVIPFAQNNPEVQNNAQIFQINQPPNTLNISASREFLRLFGNANIIFVTGGLNNRTDFVSQLQGDLRRNGIHFETITATAELNTAIAPLLSTTRQNVIVPTSDEQEFLRLIMNELEIIGDANPNYILRLFGYPNWQTFSPLIRRMHQFGTHIFTSFYADNNNPQTRAFNDNFRRWYGRTPTFNHPNFAMRGYDTGLFFLTALHRFGVNFEQHLHQLRVPTVQYTFHFERVSNWGGFINTGMFIVHYDTNGTVTKTIGSR